ncbi:N-acetylglucosamine-6-phosphate deacetylase [Rouxiella silvae]|uniref:N-acetylglucosamine-6-phosphate deacetylase n=1 Tax=Rouxiella silvae TaxID=1646373 RepID=A0ABX3TUJ4_9GAMM|nr:N-acetylglucosamine-6-phosphate deacetylase [Rouxiella silvae]ORJ18850.1 N-acetylglucosamine-6-phosphate deacetylase [Rouxiella silvae]
MWKILTPSGWVNGVIQADENGRIAQIIKKEGAFNGYIIPGFIDLHVHGGGGKDIMQGGDAINIMSQTHARFGTTSLLATTMTSSPSSLKSALKDIDFFMKKSRYIGCSRVLGVHLEGPFVSPDKLGAQPPHARNATKKEIDQLLDLAVIKLITLAAEIENNRKLIPYLIERGVCVQQGHTAATYQQSMDAISLGATGFTHLFNAMSGLDHRYPGALTAAMAHTTYAEIIPDFEHVHPGAILAARRAIPKLYAVTDSCSAVGMPAGEYTQGGYAIYKCAGKAAARLKNGTLAASTLTMDKALLNFIELGLTLEEASLRLSTYPAEFLGIKDRGRLEINAWADYVILDESFKLQETVIEGVSVPL